MKKLNFTIRPYKKGDEISINKGFNEIFNLKRPIKEWYWKFQSADPSTSIMVAVDDGNNVFAHYAAALVDIAVKGQAYKCGQPVDVYSVKQQGSVQHRLYLKTVREFFNTFGARDKIQLLFGFPSARVLKLGQLKLDYGDPVPVIVGNRKIKHRRYIFKKRPKSYSCDLLKIDQLWERCSNRYPVSIVRNSEYIKERYIDRPDNKYFYLTMDKGDQTNVFSVLEYNKHSIKWIDLIWDGINEEDLRAMDDLVETTSRLAGVNNNEMWIANDNIAKEILSKNGWTFAPHHDLFLVAMSFHPELDSNKFINELYFTMGDSDLV